MFDSGFCWGRLKVGTLIGVDFGLRLGSVMMPD